MSNDKLGWIFSSESPATLEQRYDEWAATYDADHDEWGWRGPDLVASTAVRLNSTALATGTIIDAGCGTGRAGKALRDHGWAGEIIGLDFSQGMLDIAAASGAYSQLLKCSLLDIPLDDGAATAVVSSGVFTHGHVGGEAFSELCRVTAPGGKISVTVRLDLVDELQPHMTALARAGKWAPIERSAPERSHPDNNETEQTVMSWRVLD